MTDGKVERSHASFKNDTLPKALNVQDLYKAEKMLYGALVSDEVRNGNASADIVRFSGKEKSGIRYSKSGEKVDKIGLKEYNNRIGKDEEDARGWYDFRRVQEEARREFAKSDKEHKRNTRNDEKLQTLLRGILSRELVNRGINASHANEFLAESKKNGTKFRLFGNVDGNTFHDVFEVARAFTRNGELVDLHEVKSSDDGIGYEDCTNYLSDDGLSGFSITPKGDLISVFNANASKPGFLDAISEFVKQEATTLDCYASPNQNLMEMYKKKFGIDKNTGDGSDGHMKTSEKESSDVLFSKSKDSVQTIPKGEDPARDVDVRAFDERGGKVSEGVRTVRFTSICKRRIRLRRSLGMS